MSGEYFGRVAARCMRRKTPLRVESKRAPVRYRYCTSTRPSSENSHNTVHSCLISFRTREKEVEPEAGAKRVWASRVDERKWRRVGSPEPEEEGKVEEEVGEGIVPEKEEGFRLPVMVKVGGVRWGDGIGGVLAGLQGTGIVSCEGSRWLVGKEERERRRRGGSKSSMVLLKVLGVEAARVLCSSGLWVGGYWCSVTRFAAIPLRRKDKGWVDRFSLLADKLEHVRRGLARVEGVVKREDVDVGDVRLPRKWKKEMERKEDISERMEERFQRMMAQEESCGWRMRSWESCLMRRRRR